MKNFSHPSLKLVLFYFGTCFLAACGTAKDTVMSRGMQNITARYNYIYNANVILDDYQQESYETYRDNYNELLPVYTNPEKFSSNTVLNPPANEKALDAIIKKAQVIIADKTFSNYIDDAYLLLGKSHYLKTNYFVAEEYFDYTAKTYPANPNIRISAMNWKARSLMQLDNLKEAALILDTVYSSLPVISKNKAEPIATIAQMYIFQQRYSDAIPLLETAAKTTHLKRNRIRWTYILAQLYEKQKNYRQALYNYVKVQKSNADFELYFNANLNKIKINGLLNGEHLNRKKQLLALLRDDKNLEYHDQIYFHVAESYADDGNFPEAERYYKLSVKNSVKNRYQKGISYLRLANLNFNQLKNFLKAKSYYDSTVNTLPTDYPGYEFILKKSENLEYLSSRYRVIDFEDTLQMLAKLPEEARLARIKMINKPAPLPVLNTGEFKDNPFPDAVKRNTAATSRNTAAGIFYFSNSTAVSKGHSAFLVKWGNRKRGDNWRQSTKSSAQTTTENIAKVENEGLPLNGKSPSDTFTGSDTSISRYLSAIPLNPASLRISNQNIIDTYYEIANFYQQELDDQQEAARIYQLVLSRFPENNRLASIYYSLYLSYKNSDPEQAAKYKTHVLNQFPASIYAKIILDPDYSAKQSEREAIVIAKYNQIFGEYERKDFPEVITEVNRTVTQYPNNPINPQLAYLKAIAIGRTQPIDSLITAFKQITIAYPNDKVIVPLVNDHLTYIAAHLPEFSKRKVALPDFNPAEPRFFTMQDQSPAVPSVTDSIPENDVTAPGSPVIADKIFSTALSQVYYFVIAVEDASLTLSSSRFGIGQFNRGNYAESGLKHQLTEFDNDQLIYVGNFSSFAAAKDYAGGIIPQLKQIMKVPAGVYFSFIISKENFEKLQRKDLMIKYLEFYKNNY